MIDFSLTNRFFDYAIVTAPVLSVKGEFWNHGELQKVGQVRLYREQLYVVRIDKVQNQVDFEQISTEISPSFIRVYSSDLEPHLSSILFLSELAERFSAKYLKRYLETHSIPEVIINAACAYTTQIRSTRHRDNGS